MAGKVLRDGIIAVGIIAAGHQNRPEGQGVLRQGRKIMRHARQKVWTVPVRQSHEKGPCHRPVQMGGRMGDGRHAQRMAHQHHRLVGLRNRVNYSRYPMRFGGMVPVGQRNGLGRRELCLPAVHPVILSGVAKAGHKNDGAVCKFHNNSAGFMSFCQIFRSFVQCAWAAGVRQCTSVQGRSSPCRPAHSAPDARPETASPELAR